MPVPPLPLELVPLIVDHLGCLVEDEPLERQRNGLAIALVCRVWRSLGAGLVWKHVVLESPEQARRFVAQLSQHCSGIDHVRGLDIQNGTATDAGEFGRSLSTTMRLAEIGAFPIRLTSLSLNRMCWLVGSLFLCDMSRTDSASTLQHLSLIDRRFDCDPELFLLAISRFSRLRTLHFDVSSCNDIGPVPTLDRARTPLPLIALTLAFFELEASTTLPMHFISALLSLVDPTTLRHFTGIVERAEPFPLPSLTPFTNLDRLFFHLHHLENPSSFLPDLVRLFPNLPALRFLQIFSNGDGMQKLVPPAVLTLPTLLKALPPSFLRLAIDGVCFPQSAFPTGREPRPVWDGAAWLQAEGEEDYVVLLRDRSDGKWWREAEQGAAV